MFRRTSSSGPGRWRPCSQSWAGQRSSASVPGFETQLRARPVFAPEFSWACSRTRQLRPTASPLVNLRLLGQGSVLRVNLAMLIAGMGLYLLFSLLTRYVQTPAGAPYGFALPGVAAGAALIPFSLLGFVAGKSLPRLVYRITERWTYALSAAIAIAAALLFERRQWIPARRRNPDGNHAANTRRLHHRSALVATPTRSKRPHHRRHATNSTRSDQRHESPVPQHLAPARDDGWNAAPRVPAAITSSFDPGL